MGIKFEYIKAFFQAVWTSIVRTFVPQIAGAILAITARYKLDVDSEVVFLAVTEAFALVYYVLFRGLETFRSSEYGRWLGKAVRPFYFDEDI